MHKVTVIIGTTASGKSEAALKLATDSTLVIGADAHQAYMGLECITAACVDFKRSILIAQTPLSGFLDLFTWFNSVKQILCDQNNKPDITDYIVVGGSSMYVYSLLNGISPVPHCNTRAEATHIVDTKGISYALSLLGEVCKEPHPQDRHRVIRFLEVYLHHNKCLHHFWKETIHIDANFCVIYIDIDLADNIANSLTRINAMITPDTIEHIGSIRHEIRHRLDRIIGIKEILSYLDKEISLNECKAIIQSRTVKLIKHQKRWINNKILPLCKMCNIPVEYRKTH